MPDSPIRRAARRAALARAYTLHLPPDDTIEVLKEYEGFVDQFVEDVNKTLATLERELTILALENARLRAEGV